MSAPSSPAVTESFRHVPLLASLDDAGCQAVLNAGKLVDYVPGSLIVREGGRAETFFILLSGAATVSVDGDGEGRSVDLSVLRPGETFGELGALLSEARTATVTADSRCRVLELDVAALEHLFAQSPAFSLAFCRELAQRLKHALALKDELQVQNVPDKVKFEAPDLTRMREYMINYYATALRHIFKRHRLLVNRRFPSYECSFRLTTGEQQQWLKLFGTDRIHTPFTYHTVVGTMVLMRVVGDVGVNFKNLMHLKSEMSIATAVIEVDRNYRLTSGIEDIVPLRDDRVVLICSSRVFDDSGHRIRSYRDYFIILNLDAEYIEALRATKEYGRNDTAQFAGLAAREATIGRSVDDARVAPIDIPENMGFLYGKVSGDLNLVHTTPLAAKLFGHPRPFIQGLCTANYVLTHLSRHASLESLDVTFAKRVFVGQQVEMRYSADRFEVCDRTGALLAFGSYQTQV
jgi:CRP-like cAMP-binding protein/acyl dehydratase